MSLTYLCPKCTANLNPNIRVVLIASFEDRRGIVLLSPQLGDYQFVGDKGFYKGVKKGDLLEFFCPVCHASLTSESKEHFTELLLTNTEHPDDQPALIRFSRVTDEHATFVYHGDTVKEYGEDARFFHKQMIVEGDWRW